MAPKTRRPTSIMGDTEAWLKHARRKEICGVGSDIPSELQDVHYTHLGRYNIAIYRILSVAKSVVVSQRMNCQFIKYIYRSCHAHQDVSTVKTGEMDWSSNSITGT